MFVLSVIITTLVIYCIWYVIKYIMWALRAANISYNIPGPKPWPIVGNGLMLANVKTAQDAYEFVMGVSSEYCKPPGKLMKIWLGPKLMIVIANPKYIETILTSPDALQKDSVYKFVALFGNGLFVRNGREWEDLRKPLNKILTKKMIESNLDMFHDKSKKLCKVLKKYAETGEYFNLRNFVTNYTVDTLCLSNFGYDLNEIENNNHNIYECVESVVELIIKLSSNFLFMICLPLTKISKEGRYLKEIVKPLWKICCKILQDRIETRKKIGEDIDGDKPVLYSDVIIHKAKEYKLSWEETGKLATDFFIAGFDTSAVIASYTLLLLAMFPEHQKAVCQELLDILGANPEVVPTWEQLSKLTYLTNVIKETMRLYCPPGIFRKITNDLDLGDGYKLPEGCSVFLLIYYLHRDPTIWSHPDKFHPDHFLPEECAKRPKGSYFPFSWGPRSCPGSIYAMATIKILVSTVIRNYKLETDLEFHNLEYSYSILLEVSAGYMVRIKPRNCDSSTHFKIQDLVK